MATHDYESPWYESEDDPYDSGDSGRVRVQYIRPASPQWGAEDEQEQDGEVRSDSQTESGSEEEDRRSGSENEDAEPGTMEDMEDDPDQNATILPSDSISTPPEMHLTGMEELDIQTDPQNASEFDPTGDDDSELVLPSGGPDPTQDEPVKTQSVVSREPSASDAGEGSQQPEIPPPLIQQPTPEPSDHPPTKKPLRFIPGRKRGLTNPAKKNNKGYIRLLNSETAAAYRRRIYTDKQHRIRTGSQILGSWWTAKEKEKFFDALAILGVDSIDKIAVKVKTKSLLECTVYLRELKAGLEHTRSFVRFRRRDTVTVADIPGAVELGEVCIRTLDYEAGKLARKEAMEEEEKEKEKWGEFWSIGATLADHLGQCWENDDIEKIEAIAPEAELLNVSNMLGLSMLFFMNTPGEDNYRNVSDDLPAIQYTALIDFHTLVTQLLRRLIATTLSVSQGRIFRAKNRKVHHPVHQIYRSDVHAAAKMLGIPTSSRKYWIGVPRRNKVGVVQTPVEMRYAQPRLLTYEQVEGFLSKIDSYSIQPEFQRDIEGLWQAKREEREAYRRAEESVKPKPRTPLPEDKGQGGQNESDADEVVNEEEEAFRKLPAAERRRIKHLNARIEEEDRYLYALDARNDRIAERGIWAKILPYADPPQLSPNPKVPKKPRREARHAQVMKDWRRKLCKHFRPLWIQKRVLRPWEKIERKRKLIKLGLAEESDYIWRTTPGRARWNPPWLPPWRPRKCEEGWDGGAYGRGDARNAHAESQAEKKRLVEQKEEAEDTIIQNAKAAVATRGTRAMRVISANPQARSGAAKRRKADVEPDEGDDMEPQVAEATMVKTMAASVKPAAKSRTRKRKKAQIGDTEDEGDQHAYEEEGPQLPKATRATKKAARVKQRSKSHIMKKKQAEIDVSDGEEEEAQGKVKRPTARSPRKKRARRQSSVHPGYVSVMEVDMGDEEVQADIRAVESGGSEFEGSD